MAWCHELPELSGVAAVPHQRRTTFGAAPSSTHPHSPHTLKAVAVVQPASPGNSSGSGGGGSNKPRGGGGNGRTARALLSMGADHHHASSSNVVGLADGGSNGSTSGGGRTALLAAGGPAATPLLPRYGPAAPPPLLPRSGSTLSPHHLQQQQRQREHLQQQQAPDDDHVPLLLRQAERQLRPLLLGWRAADSALAAWNAACLFTAAFCLRRLSAVHLELAAIYYQPLAAPLLMLWLWTINVAVFEMRSIRYEVCFSARDQRCLASSLGICQIALYCTTLFLTSLAAFSYCCAADAVTLAGWQPPLLYCSIVALLLWPGDALSKGTRRLFRKTLGRVAIPFREVTWSDFLLADLLTSLARPIGDMCRALCHLAEGPAMQSRGKVCEELPWLVPLGTALPFLWRLCQCLRVYRDTGSVPQLFNALKYSTALPPLLMAWVQRRAPEGMDWVHTWLPLALATGLVNTAYSYYWDVERDWDISFFSVRRSKKGSSSSAAASKPAPPALLPSPHLRSELLYVPRFYHYLMASNLVLRLGWVWRLLPRFAASPTASLLLNCLEAFRRFQWAFVRLEVELRKLQHQRPELGTLVPARRSNGGGGNGGGGGVPAAAGIHHLRASSPPPPQELQQQPVQHMAYQVVHQQHHHQRHHSGDKQHSIHEAALRAI